MNAEHQSVNRRIKADLSHKRSGETGAAILLLTMGMVAMVGVVGLGVDAGQMYVAKQKAQGAADAAAQAGAMDMYNGTNSGTNAFGSATVTCPATGGVAPCVYARLNGFGTGADVVKLDFGYPSAAPTSPSCVVSGVSLSSSDAVNLICVTVQRTVNTTLLRVLGTNSSTVTATATAAIAANTSAAPIIVLHPTLPGAFSTNGTGAGVKICGGPTRSFQVNSSSATSISVSGNGTVDLSHAGPNDPGTCLGGGPEGGNFANVGSQASYPGNLLLGANGLYISPASAIQDPLISVPAPTQPGTAGSSVSYSTAATETAHGCPTTCTVYSPGFYSSTINLSGFSVFRPGIYWMGSGASFTAGSNTILRMAQAVVDQTDPVTGTGWNLGMLIYNSGTGVFSIASNSGRLPGNNTYPTTDCPAGGNCLSGGFGTLATGVTGITTYKGILLFQNRSVATNLMHSLSGGSGLSVTGTLYSTHTAPSIRSDGHYQTISMQGGASGSTTVQGEIIADVLTFGGNASVTMNLTSAPIFNLRQVALVK